MKISWKEDTFLGIYSENHNEIGQEYFKNLRPITIVIIEWYTLLVGDEDFLEGRHISWYL